MAAPSNAVLVVRADATPEIGSGHVMRTFALAQEWLRCGGSAVFLTYTANGRLLQRVRDGGAEVVQLAGRPYQEEDLKATLGHMSNRRAAWLVLDGYCFDTEYQKAVRDAGYRLLVIDDLANVSHYYADVLLNQNLGAHTLVYSTESYTERLLGTQYVLLRQEFSRWRWRSWSAPKVVRRVLVTLGGSDRGNYTLRVLRALRGLDQLDLEVKVAIGTLNPHENSLEESIRDWEPPAVTLIRDVADISELMAWADLAVCSGGTTCWELAFMGLPALLVVLAENQASVACGLDKAGAAGNLGWHWQLSDAALADRLGAIMSDQKTRSSMSARGRELVDGLGCQRVAACLEEKSRG